MTVRQLRKIIDNLSDDTELVVPSEDDSYRRVKAESRTAVENDDGDLTVDYDDGEPGPRVPVLVLLKE